MSSAKICSNCNSEEPFTRYILDGASKLSGSPSPIHRCPDCGISLSQDEYDELEEADDE